MGDIPPDGTPVFLCDHVALFDAPKHFHPQDPPTRALGTDLRVLAVRHVVLCASCTRRPGQAAEGMFLAVMRNGQPVPER